MEGETGESRGEGEGEGKGTGGGNEASRGENSTTDTGKLTYASCRQNCTVVYVHVCVHHLIAPPLVLTESILCFRLWLSGLHVYPTDLDACEAVNGLVISFA